MVTLWSRHFSAAPVGHWQGFHCSWKRGVPWAEQDGAMCILERMTEESGEIIELLLLSNIQQTNVYFGIL